MFKDPYNIPLTTSKYIGLREPIDNIKFNLGYKNFVSGFCVKSMRDGENDNKNLK